MKNHVHLPTGENEEIYFYGIMTERFGLFSTLWQRTLNSRPHKNPPMGSRSAVLNAVLLKLVAKDKGRISFFQYSPNLLDFPRLFDDIQNLLLLRWFWWQFFYPGAFKTPGKSKNANWNGNFLDYCTAGAL